MISLTLVLLVCFTHWVADFVFQTDWMAQNKSKSNFPLLTHVCVYTFIFSPLAVYAFDDMLLVLYFLGFNLFAHFIVDYNTSRLSSKLYKQNKLGSSTVPNFGFFSVIGFDQFLHYVCLFGSYVYLSSL